MEPDKKPARIVSKAEYVKVQSLRIGLVLSTLCLAILFPGYGVLGRRQFHEHPFIAFVIGLLATMIVVVYTIRVIPAARAIGKVIPLTRANTADLTAVDSLVRASEQPEQAQADVLLRAVTDVQQTPPEQLLRSTTGEEVR